MNKHIRYGVLAATFTALSINPSFTQQPLNLDFEKLSVEGPARPWGWAVYSYAPNVVFQCDSAEKLSGNYSLKIHNPVPADTSPFELSFFVEPSQILDAKIQLEGWFKTGGFWGKAGISLKSVGSIGTEYGVLQENHFEINVEQQEIWTACHAGISLESEPHSLFVTLHFSGSGTVWFDKLQLRINGNPVKSVPVAPQFSADEQNWLTANVQPFATVEPASGVKNISGKFSDLAYFKSLVGNAKIIALGESTHGTSEFFKVKHRLLQYAVTELGVRVFVLEDNMLPVERINNYVLNGEGEPENLMRGLFAVWNTAEMLELIKWLRTYNLEHPEAKVEFVGMDVQNPKPALDSLDAFLAKQDTALQTLAAQSLADFKMNWQNAYYLDDSTFSVWKQKAKQVSELMQARKDNWLQSARNTSDSSAVIWAMQYARLINQCIYSMQSGGFSGRDEAMAENIDWILANRPKGTQALVWAHDSHVCRGEASDPEENYFLGECMGAHLSQKYGSDYRAFGLFTYQGKCRGTISYSNLTFTEFNLFTSPGGSLDAGLHHAATARNSPNLMLDLRPLKNNKDYRWMNIRRPVRYAGYVAEDYGFGGRYVIPYQFDGIIFIDTTSAAQGIR